MSLNETGPISPARLIQILNGLGVPITAQLAAILAQLDVALSTRASEATITAILAQLDVALSTRASEATIAAILAQLDVALSTRASEATATSIDGKLPALEAGRVPTQDSGLHTNPERWLHDNHWEADEVTIAAAGVGGEQNLGVVVPGGATRRIRELTIRNTNTLDVVVTLLISGGVTKLTLDVPTGTTRVWSSPDGRAFDPGEQPAVQSSAAAVGEEVYVSASGVEV